jgi:hypothetical protein
MVSLQVVNNILVVVAEVKLMVILDHLQLKMED